MCSTPKVKPPPAPPIQPPTAPPSAPEVNVGAQDSGATTRKKISRSDLTNRSTQTKTSSSGLGA